jgi:hypothetical protein
MAIVRPITIIGVRTGAIIGWATIIAVAGAIAVTIGMGRSDSARGDRTGGEAEREARADAARLSRCCDRGHADGCDGSKDCECLLHDLLLRIWGDNVEGPRWFADRGTAHHEKNLAANGTISGEADWTCKCGSLRHPGRGNSTKNPVSISAVLAGFFSFERQRIAADVNRCVRRRRR